LNGREFNGGKQRIHALQLSGNARKMLPEPAVRAIERRAAEIRTSVTPPVPPGMRAELRPYQIEGFHFSPTSA